MTLARDLSGAVSRDNTAVLKDLKPDIVMAPTLPLPASHHQLHQLAYDLCFSPPWQVEPFPSLQCVLLSLC